MGAGEGHRGKAHPTTDIILTNSWKSISPDLSSSTAAMMRRRSWSLTLVPVEGEGKGTGQERGQARLNEGISGQYFLCGEKYKIKI